MVSRVNPPSLPSWIPPSIVWTTIAEVFCIEVSISDPDIVKLISKGKLDVTVCGTAKTAPMLAILFGEDTLYGQLEMAVWQSKKLRPREGTTRAGVTVSAYCHGVFLLPGEGSLAVLVSRNNPHDACRWISTELKAKADILVLEHEAAVAVFDEEMRRKREAGEELWERCKAMGEPVLPKEAFFTPGLHGQGPRLVATDLLPFLPRGVTFLRNSSSLPGKAAKAVLTAITQSNLQPSRDGTYTAVVSCDAGQKAQGVVTWKPHGGLPSYIEVRWAVQRRLTSALCKPRLQKPGRPEFETSVDAADKVPPICGNDVNAVELAEVFSDLEFDLGEFRGRTDDFRNEVKANGFEAIAWFQSYHVWTEETWGIYIDAQKLDDLARSLLDDFKEPRIQGAQRLAAFLAFGLTYEHELFHAKVEAALSWAEINALQPRYLRYKSHVYDALRETSDWLEEALANWSAWKWFHSSAVQDLINRMLPSVQALERVVAASLDLAPPGYRDWRLGDHATTWRTFASQLATANPKLGSPRLRLPLESILTGPLPFDLQPLDVPLRFLGQGVIADRLQSHPATFNVPSRRELEKALKYFGHIVDVSAGKGGHQKWTGRDQRAFILPTRDPVSPTVFRSFLHHMGIDKTAYVHDVRPLL